MKVTILSIQILLILLLLSFSGCSYFKKWEHLPQTKQEERTIYVLSHGWHTGIIVASKDLGKNFDFLKERFGSSTFYEFGWGDKAYYQAKEVTSGITLKAVFWPTPSVIHVVAVPFNPKAYFPNSQTLAVNVSRKGLDYLSSYLYDTFKRYNNSVIPTKRGLYGESQFYEAKGSYYMTNTCNSYTITALSKAGLPLDSFTLRAGSVMSQTKDAIDSYPKEKILD
jgi:uncharacterized protein (TIGR02117 family)